jgi:tRNA pseudouridine38-40 synthase
VRLKLTIAYDGTNFKGWARQHGQRTVQGVIEQGILDATGIPHEMTGASRTDSGAHAHGQVAHFDTELQIEPQKWVRILNKVLPEDVAIKASVKAPPHFHARFCAEWRLYRYRIRTGGRDPFEGRFAHEFGRPLDVEEMRHAASFLIGTHDFRAFTEELDPHIENTERSILSIGVTSRRHEVWIDVRGTAFLRGMMRRISGGLLEVGRGHRKAQEMALLLDEQREKLQWPVVLPAKGLTLMAIRYGRPLTDCRQPAPDDQAD